MLSDLGIEKGTVEAEIAGTLAAVVAGGQP